MPKEHFFYRLNMESGTKSVGTFNGSHDSAFVEHNNQAMDLVILTVKLSLVNKWNAQQPHVWKYWI